MSDFDPYYKWLGIPPEEQPPTHYRLLGIQTLEKNTEVIEAASNRQMAYLQELSGGDEHIDEAQRLLGEVAKARVCLLNTESKARYDAELTSALDALPEAKEASSTHTPATAETPLTVPVAEPIEVKPSGRSRRSTSGGGARKTTAGRSRTGRTPKGASGSSKGGKTKSSNDLAIKIGALAGTAIVVLVVGILLLGGGGSDSGKKPKLKTAPKTNTPSSSVASKAGAPVPVSSEAAKKKTDSEFERRLARLENQNPNSPKPKPADVKPAGSSSSLTNVDSVDNANNTDADTGSVTTETDVGELSEIEKAEALLNSKGLEEGFNSEWELAEMTAAYEQVKSTNRLPSKAGSDGGFEMELIRQKRYYFNSLKNFYKRTNYQQHPAIDPTAKEAAAYLNSVGQRPFTNNTEILLFTLENGAPVQFQVPSDIPAISLTEKVRREVSSMSVLANDSTEADEIASLMRAQYAALQANVEIQAALETVGGKLAEAPEILASANLIQAETPSPAQEPSVPSKSSKQFAEAESGTDGSDGGDGVKDEKAIGDKPEKSTVNFDELKEKLEALEKETKITLGAFNKKAKTYISNKKNLVKRIKAGEALYARRGRQQDAIQYPEEKTKFGQETEAKVVKPLNALKAQLKTLAKPGTAPLEEKLKQAEKMIKQLKTTSAYAANPKSVDSLAALIAKYRNGFEVQQAKMAK